LCIVLLYEKGQESLLKFNHTQFEPKHLTVKLSPVSVTGKVEIWYDQTAGRVGGDWIKLKDEFCFPAAKVFALGTEWKISLLTAKSGTPHRILEDAKETLRWLLEPLFPTKPTDHPISCILSPPPRIVENYRTN
jgi:hypothetical protein